MRERELTVYRWTLFILWVALFIGAMRTVVANSRGWEMWFLGVVLVVAHLLLAFIGVCLGFGPRRPE